MFYYLMGELAYKDLNTCVIDCSGVGYKLTVSQITSENLSSYLGKKVKLFTHLAVREDGIELFGFGTEEERSCFNKLISVSGVGPKAATSILSVMTPEALSIAICTNDPKAIAKAQGIGGKTAARIILELKDKISKDISLSELSTTAQSISAGIVNGGKNTSEAIEALTVLGYDKSTILSVMKNIDTNLDVGDIIKAALKQLAK